MNHAFRKTKRWPMLLLSLLMLLALLLSSISAGRLVSHAASGVREWQVGEDVRALLYPDGLMVLEGQGDTWDYAPGGAPFYAERGDILRLEIGSGVTSVGSYLFADCGGLSGELRLPSTLVSLGERAFYGMGGDAPRFSQVYNDFTGLDIVITETPEPEPEPEPEYIAPEPEYIEPEPEIIENDFIPEPEPDFIPEPEMVENDFIPEPEYIEPEPEPDFISEPEMVENDFIPEPEYIEPEPQPDFIPEPEYIPEPEPVLPPAPITRVETITEQLLGAEIFAPGQMGVFSCFPDNRSFIAAAEAAGWQELLGWGDIVLSDGWGNSESHSLPRAASGLLLPSYESAGLPWPSDSLHSYSFLAWEDEAGGYEPGSFYDGFSHSLNARWQAELRPLEYQELSARAGDLLVSISGELPRGAQISAEQVEIATAQAALDAGLGGEREQTVLYALDISLLVEGQKYQPRDYGEAVTVSIANIQVEEEAPLAVYHLPESAGAPEEIAVESADANSLAFSAENFSLYVITMTVEDITHNVTFDDSDTDYYAVEYSADGVTFTPLTDDVSDFTGDTLYFKITPVTGFVIGTVTADYAAVSAPVDGVYTLDDITADTMVNIPCLGVSGTPSVGQPLTALASGISNDATYQWQSSANGMDNWNPIPGANSGSYTVTQADATAGHFLRVQVTDTVNDKEYSFASISPGQAGVYIIFDLAKGNVELGLNGQYSGYAPNSTATAPDRTGQHFNTNRYLVKQSSPAPVGYYIKITGDEEALSFDLTIDSINSDYKKNSSSDPGGSIWIHNYRAGDVENPYGKNIYSNVILRLKGTNTLKQLYYRSFDTSSSLTITSAAGDNSTDGILNIDCDHVYFRAAIGGCDGTDKRESENITINGGTFNLSANKSTVIGGGGNGNASITINGGHITARAHVESANGCAIGGGWGGTSTGGRGIVTINGGTVIARNEEANSGGVAIGGGGSYDAVASTGNVTINGGHITAYGNIGGGRSGKANGGDAIVTVSGGTVNVEGGIGGGNTENVSNTASVGGNATVKISGGTVVANSVGGGYSVANGYRSADVEISGGSVHAKIAGTPKNGKSPDEPVFLTRAILYYQDSEHENEAVSELDISRGNGNGNYNYRVHDIRTDAAGMLYLWLPDGAVLNSARARLPDLFTGEVGVKEIGALTNSCAKQYYSLNVACSDLYKLYNSVEEHANGEEFRGARTVPAGTVIDGYLQANRLPDDSGYYGVTAYISEGTGMVELEPVIEEGGFTDENAGKYHYQITVTTDMEVFFICADSEGNTTVLDIAGADVVISGSTHEDATSTSLKVVRKGFTLDPYDGKFLLTSDNQITSTAAGQPAIQVDSGAKLTIEANTPDNSLKLTGGANAPAIGGAGQVVIEKTQGHLVLTKGTGATSQIEAGSLSFKIVDSTGKAPYSLKLAEGDLVAYQQAGDTPALLAATATSGFTSYTLYKSCGLRYDHVPASIEKSVIVTANNIAVTLTGADRAGVTRGGVVISQANWWDNVNKTLNIPAAQAYGNLVVTAGAASDILYTVAAYNGPYTGSEANDGHGIIVTPTVPDNAEVRYKDDDGNYLLTASPKFTEAGTHTVYFKITANGYNPTTGSAQVVISQGENVWLESLICASVPYGEPVIPSAAAKWGTVNFSYTKADGNAVELVNGKPISPGVYYVTAEVTETANYTGLTSERLRFTIESTEVYLSSGRELATLLGERDLARSISIPANGAVTVLYRFQYYPSIDTLLGLRFEPALPPGTKITFMDVSEEIPDLLDTPIYMYYIVPDDPTAPDYNANGCDYISTAGIRVMGSNEVAREAHIYDDFLRSQQVFNSAYQFSIEFPEDRNLPQEDTVITLLRGSEAVANAGVTINFGPPVSETTTGSISIGNAAAGDGDNTISVPLTVSATGAGRKVLALTLSGVDELGNKSYSIPGSYTATLSGGPAGNVLTDKTPDEQHGNFLVFDLGTADIASYTVDFSDVMEGDYQVQAEICVIPVGQSLSYPCHGRKDMATTGNLNVSGPDQWLNVRGSNHLVSPGGTLALTLNYNIKGATGTPTISMTVLKDGQPATGWTVTGLPNIILDNSGEDRGEDIGLTVNVPSGVEAGDSYQLIFTLNTPTSAATDPYIVIIQNDSG